MNDTEYFDLMNEVVKERRRVNFLVQTGWLTGIECDEIALMFDTPDALDRWLACVAEDSRVEHFNSVLSDRMVRKDQPGSFDVRFEFVRFLDSQWRIEAMCVLGGEAPLHETRARNAGRSPFIIHASFKLPAPIAYANWKIAAKERGLAQRTDLRMHAEYRNSYGVFSYWTGVGLDTTFLKPRVNLRDS